MRGARWGGRSLGAAAAVTVGIVAACNSDGPLGPDSDQVGGQPILPQFSVSGGTSGSAQIGIPATNGSADAFGSVPAFEVFSASRFDFIYIEVTGAVTSTDAGFCDPAQGEEGTWDAFGVNGAGPLGVAMTSNPNIGLQVGGQGTGTMTVARGTGSDVTISAQRNGYSASCGAGPGLNLSGSQTISYEAYPAFEITATPGAVTLGDTVTFTATSHWTTTNNSWRYANNDTTATPAGIPLASTQVCGDVSVCNYAPTQSGRIYRVGTFPAPEQNTFGAPGPIVWVGNPPPINLQLSSSLTPGDSVARSDSVDFSVSNTGAGGELNATELHWKFEPDSVQFYPAKPVQFAPDAVWDTVAADSTWSGRIVHPGKVIVTGQSGTNTSADTFVVPVARRTFSPPTVVLDSSAYNSEQSTLPSPTSAGNIIAGVFHTIPANSLSDSTFFTIDSLAVDSILAGPNKGYHYVVDAHYQLPRAYSLNLWIDPPGQFPYYHGHSTTDWLINQGDSLGMVQLRSNVIMHERGPSSIAQDSHPESHDIAGSNLPACGDVNNAVERLVFSTHGQLDFYIAHARTEAFKTIRYRSGHYYVYGFIGLGSYALADPSPKGNIITSGLSEPQDPNNDNYPPPDSIYCDISTL
jgi:hypothetical protein